MKSRLLITIIVGVALIFVIGSVFAGNQASANEEAASDEMPGYTNITCVEGVSFYVNSTFADTATAITQISDNVKFQSGQYYSYKNGSDKFLLFNMDNLIIACQKGTDFWIGESNDPEYSLLNASMMNIWFTQGSKKFESETQDYQTITKADAGVCINSATYGDFCGKLKNIVKDGEEWSLFVGVPGDRYDKLSDDSQNGIDTILSTFTFSDNSDLLNQEVYAVTIDGDSSKEKVDTAEEVLEDTDTSLNLSNQNTIVDKDEEKAYTSTPYNMLSLNDNGILSAFNDSTLTYEEPIICPTNIYRGDEAIAIIQRFCTTTSQYEYAECDPGSAWEVVEYDVNYKNCENDDYVNIKIKGVDGEDLRYRGIKYTDRTYDMVFETEEDGNWVRHYYTYYAVPNGCTEYCLECGERESKTDDEVNAAYYHIVNEDVHSEQNVSFTEEDQSERSSETSSVETSSDTGSSDPAMNSSENSSEAGSDASTDNSSDASSESSTEENSSESDSSNEGSEESSSD